MMTLAALLFAPAFAPVRPGLSALQPRAALSSSPLLALPRKSVFPAMQAEASTSDTPEVVEDGTCIEDEAVEECVLAKWDAGSITVPASWVETAKVGTLMTLWFFLNVMYNITNKKCQNAFPMPWTMTVVSLFVGVPWILMLWATGIRKAPKIPMEGWKTLLPIGAAHALGHAGAVIALGAGAVSFAQTVKAAEPVFTCVMSYFVLGTVFKWQVYSSLLPIIAGVSLASLKELSFTWKALYGALLSNVAFASRAVLSKATMQKPVGENMTAPNLYGVLTILAFLMSLLRPLLRGRRLRRGVEGGDRRRRRLGVLAHPPDGPRRLLLLRVQRGRLHHPQPGRARDALDRQHVQARGDHPRDRPRLRQQADDARRDRLRHRRRRHADVLAREGQVQVDGRQLHRRCAPLSLSSCRTLLCLLVFGFV